MDANMLTLAEDILFGGPPDSEIRQKAEILAEMAIQKRTAHGYTDRAGIDSRANSALLAIETILTDYTTPSAIRLVLVAQRMATEPILTDQESPAAFEVREQAAAYTRRRNKS